MIQKCVVIMVVPFGSRWYKYFFMEELLNDSISLEYWDCSSLFSGSRSKTVVTVTQIQRSYQSSTTIPWNQLVEKIKSCDLSATLFVPQVPPDYRTLPLFRLLARNKCRTAFFASGALPMAAIVDGQRSRKLIGFLRKLFSLETLSGWLRSRFANISLYCRPVKAFELIFQAGSFGRGTLGFAAKHMIDNHTRVIPFHYGDYDDWLSIKRRAPHNASIPAHIVFIDENFPDHPDWRLLCKDIIPGTQYYHELNLFFDALEKQYGMSVVIAAHPSRDVSQNPFGGRRMEKGCTGELIATSKLAVAHFTTAVSFAVLSEVPLVFVTSALIARFWDGRIDANIRGMAATLGAICVDMNEESLVVPILNKTLYNAYALHYLYSKSDAERSSAEIVSYVFRHI